MRPTLPIAALLMALAAGPAAAQSSTNPPKGRTEARERLERAENEVAARRDRAVWADRMARQGNISSAHRRAEERQLRTAEDALGRLRRQAERVR